jgi:hypothetical protein
MPISAAAQSKRIADRLSALEDQLTKRRAWFQDNAISTSPDTVMVLELAKPIANFVSAAARLNIPVLGEWDGEDIDAAASGFHVFAKKDKLKKEQRTTSHVYLSSFNLTTVDEFRRLFARWKAGDPWPKDGTTAWRDLFNCILEIRPWGPRDRLRDSGLIEDWQDAIDAGETSVEFEADFWFRAQSAEARQASETQLAVLLTKVGGSIQHKAVIESIGYHGVLGRIPISAIGNLNAIESLDFVQYDEIFEIHPVTQAMDRSSSSGPSMLAPSKPTATADTRPSIIGLIDGVPLQNHPDIAGGVVVEDADDLESEAPAAHRIHGTAMASLILNGDLGAQGARLQRRITIRPVLVPFLSIHGTYEGFPRNKLAIDTFHRAVLDLLRSEGTQVAPDQPYVINVSLGDPKRAFLRKMSPWARLLDWLAYRYRILFVVSAGNRSETLKLEVPSGGTGSMNSTELQSALLQSMYAQRRNRSILSPGESINALTIGAAHGDATNAPVRPPLVDPIVSPSLMSPASAIGHGYRTTIKPDMLSSGGRQLYRESPGSSSETSAVLELVGGVAPPGALVAAPHSPIDAPKRWHFRGTSVAAALTTRLAAQIYEELEQLPAAAQICASRNVSVLLKALLAHTASWDEDATGPLIDMLVKNGVAGAKLKENIARFLGHGVARPSRAFRCTDHRVTVLGDGELRHGEAHVFRFPWPRALRARVDERRVTVTLASLVPTAPTNYAYRGADVWVAKPDECTSLGLAAGDRDHNAIQRGTLQHICYSGSKAAVFSDQAHLTLQVNCRADAMDEVTLPPVPYALAVTLEVAESSQIPIYEEVEIGLRAQVKVPLRQ